MWTVEHSLQLLGHCILLMAMCIESRQTSRTDSSARSHHAGSVAVC